VRAAALARDRVDAFDVLRAEVEEHLVDERDALVLAHPRLHRAEQLLVGGVDHRAGGREQRDLVLGLDHPHVLHQRLAVDDLDPLVAERLEDGELDHVDPERLAVQAALLELDPDLRGDVLRAPLHGPAERGDARP
jgi:hypothetical protein